MGASAATSGNATVRNPNNQPINISEGTIYIQGQPVNNFTAEQKQIPPKQTTQVNTTANTTNLGTLQYIAGNTQETFQCTTQERIIQANTIHEGGGTTPALAWGTTGSTSIIVPEAEPRTTPDVFCIGNDCEESTGNQAVDDAETPGDYANRYFAKMNGTIEVTEQITVDQNEDLCIGSDCDEFDGEVPKSQFYGEDGVMDGPISFVGGSGDKRGIVLSDQACIGTC
jgi:hypothetical protein